MDLITRVLLPTIFIAVFIIPASAQSGVSFESTLSSTVGELQKVLSLVADFAGRFGGGDTRTVSAVGDCMELLDLSVDEINWTIDANSSSRKHHHDRRTWLSAALGNQDTCEEGLSHTNVVLRTLIGGGLRTVTNLVADGLSNIPGSGDGRRRKLFGLKKGFPTWLGRKDRSLLEVTTVGCVNAEFVVSQDGCGNYQTVKEAIDAAPLKSEKRTVIYVKRGVYKENVEVKKKKWNIVLIGDGMGATIITGDRNVVDGWTTYRSATFAISGKGFLARDITFENTAGPEKHQAVALRSDSDLSVFYRCEFKAYQDTLYPHGLRQFYRECRISGTVDFIFGNAAAIFQNCNILARKPLPGQKNTVTAHGRKDPNQNTGFTIQSSNITADIDLATSNDTMNPTYLGRPWKPFSRTVVMQSYLGPAIQPRGWLEWNGDFALSTLYYAEYDNQGPGSMLGGRVKWPGYHIINDTSVANLFTVAQFLDGNSWLPSSGVTYTAGLTM